MGNAMRALASVASCRFAGRCRGEAKNKKEKNPNRGGEISMKGSVESPGI